MQIYDISMTISSEMMVYKNKADKKPELKFVKEIPFDSINESSISMNLHTGTHIDAAYHMDKEGQTIEKMDLTKLITSCRVIDMTQVKDGITKDDLAEHDIQPGSFLLFKTLNSYQEAFSFDFIYLTKCGAEFLAEKNIIGVGTDALGIERSQPDHETHKILMGKGIIIIEGLRLKEVPPGDYCLCALPLKINGADGAPARVALINNL
jgi:arylformamidase